MNACDVIIHDIENCFTNTGVIINNRKQNKQTTTIAIFFFVLFCKAIFMPEAKYCPRSVAESSWFYIYAIRVYWYCSKLYIIERRVVFNNWHLDFPAVGSG